MTREDIERQLQAIRIKAYDDSEAHILEKELWRAVLGAIANGADNPADLASLALDSQKIDFERWFS